MLMRGVRAGLGVLVGLALVGPVLMGCTDSAAEPDDGASSPRVSAETSASPSPSAPAKPERPEAMNRDDAEGAAAAAEYFLSLYAYSRATGDTKAWDRMSHGACEFCQQSSARVRELVQKGAEFRGGTLTTEVLQTYARDEMTGIYPLDLRVTQDPYRTVAADGSVLDSGEERAIERRVEMGRRAGDWVVIAIVPVPEGAE